MVVSPTTVAYGWARLSISNGTASNMVTASLFDRTNMEVSVSTNYPSCHYPSGGSDGTGVIKVAVYTGYNALGPNPYVRVALCNDVGDTAGVYNPAAGEVVDSVPCGQMSALTSTQVFTLALPQKAGTYRLVVSVGDTGPDARDINQVNTGGTSSAYHYDSDGNSASGGLAGMTVSNLTDGLCGRSAVVDQLTVDLAPQQGYPQQPTVTASVEPEGNAGGGFVNPKSLRIGVRAQGGTGTYVKQALTAFSTAGDATFQYPVDTDFPSASAPHEAFLGLNSYLGGTTPASEQSGLAQVAGAVDGLNASHYSWLYIENAGANFTGFVAEDDGSTGPGDGSLSTTAIVNPYANQPLDVGSGISTSGIASYEDSGHTTARDLFVRAQQEPGAADTPFLQATVEDAHARTIASTSFSTTVTDAGTSATEDSQTPTTDASGVLAWSYQVAATDQAFNRFKKSGADDPNAPPATFSTHPAYAKDVSIAGAAFASKNPSLAQPSVFGTNSEVLFEDIWTGSLADATIDANGVPTGVRSQSVSNTSGEVDFKLCTLIDTATGKVQTPGAYNAKTVDGQDVVVSATNPLHQAFGTWNPKSASVELAVAASTNDLYNSLGYDDSSDPSNGFDSLDPTGPGRSLTIAIGAADSTATRDSFALTASPDNGSWSIGQTPTGGVGFTTDSGNYGYLLKGLQVYVIDPNLHITILPDRMDVEPGDTLRFKAKIGRYLPDNTVADVLPDTPPTITIKSDPGGAGVAMLRDGQVQMTPINPDANGNSSDWEATYTFATPGFYGVLCTVVIAGGRPLLDNVAPVRVRPQLHLRIAGGNTAAPGRTTYLGENVTIGVAFMDLGTKVAPDTAEVNIARFDPALGQVVEWDGSAWNHVTTGASLTYLPMSASPGDSDLLLYTLPGSANDQAYDYDLLVDVRATKGGFEYAASSQVPIHDPDVATPSHQHVGDYTFDLPIGDRGPP